MKVPLFALPFLIAVCLFGLLYAMSQGVLYAVAAVILFTGLCVIFALKTELTFRLWIPARKVDGASPRECPSPSRKSLDRHGPRTVLSLEARRDPVPEHIRILADIGVVETIYPGDTTAEELAADGECAVRICQERGLTRILANASAVCDIALIVELFRRASDLAGPPAFGGTRVALVVPSSQVVQDALLLETASRDAKVGVRYFETREKALAWLSRSPSKISTSLLVRNFREMPWHLKSTALGSLMAFMLLPISLCPSGTHKINDEVVTLTEFWARGAGPVLCILGIVLPILGIALLRKQNWARRATSTLFVGLYVAFLVFASDDLSGEDWFSAALGGIAVAFEVYYLERWNTVVQYFGE